MCEFRKQPVSPPPGSDNECGPIDGKDKAPISLLSSLLSEHSSPSKSRTVSATSTGYLSGPSAPSSSPSTAFSSPRANEPISILRRGSNGSDGEPFHLGFAHVTATPGSPSLVAKEPAKEKQPSAILLHEPLRTASATSARRPSLKFAVAQPRPFVERVPVQTTSDDDTSIHTDPGYEEDSEDGFSDDDDDPSFIMQAMARAREAQLRNAKVPGRRPASASPPPNVQPPPRRGRGHVRVDPAAGKDHQQCSRHCSPPPSDARSTPPPGPRDGRAGSPVPSKHSDEDDDDDDEEEEDDNEVADPANPEPETRNDDDNENAILSDSDDAASPFGISAGVRHILRRASEHLPGFRRPSFTITVPADDDTPSPAGSQQPTPILRSRSLSAKTPTASHRKIAPLAPLSADESRRPSRPVTCPNRRSDF